MVAQLHGLCAQQNKRLLSVEFSYREHCKGAKIAWQKLTFVTNSFFNPYFAPHTSVNWKDKLKLFQ